MDFPKKFTASKSMRSIIKASLRRADFDHFAPGDVDDRVGNYYKHLPEGWAYAKQALTDRLTKRGDALLVLSKVEVQVLAHAYNFSWAGRDRHRNRLGVVLKRLLDVTGLTNEVWLYDDGVSKIDNLKNAYRDMWVVDEDNISKGV